MEDKIDYKEFLNFSSVINKVELRELTNFSDKYQDGKYIRDPELFGILNSIGYINPFDKDGNLLYGGVLSDMYKLTSRAIISGKLL